MFVFDNVLTAGTVLVRQQIESQNWEPSGHTDGWYIGSDGSASFFNVTLHGDLVSANYVPDTSGYKLTYLTGSAEFNALVARGVISSHSGTSHVDLTNTLANFAGIPGVEFFVGAGAAATVSDINAQISGATTTTLSIDGPVYDSGVNPNTGSMEITLLSQQDASSFGPSMTIFADQSGTAKKGSLVIDSSVGLSVGFAPTVFNGPVSILDASGKLYIESFTANQASPTGFNGPLVIGNNASVFQPLNIAIDNSRIMARNNGAVSTLSLNPGGGTVAVGGPLTAGNTAITGTLTATSTISAGNQASTHVIMNQNQIWALNGAAASGLFLNFSSAGTVQIGDGTAAGADVLCVAMRPVKFTAAGPGGTITSTTFVSSNALGTTFTVPASGQVRIDYSGRMNIVSGVSAQRAFMGVQVQANSSAGAIVYATTDTESCEVGVAASVSGNAGVFTMGKSIIATGLTPGATIFVVITNRVTANTTSIFVTNAEITVTPEM